MRRKVSIVRISLSTEAMESNVVDTAFETVGFDVMMSADDAKLDDAADNVGKVNVSE